MRETNLTSILRPFRKEERQHTRQGDTSLTSNLNPSRKEGGKHTRQRLT